jgi:hypothetical protein
MDGLHDNHTNIQENLLLYLEVLKEREHEYESFKTEDIYQN